MLTTCWETGITCPGCSTEIMVGADMLYGQHLACARKAAENRRKVAGSQETLSAAQLTLQAGGRIMLTRTQLRALVTLACQSDPEFTPVRRPDKGHGPMQWYGRITGWSPARVAAGLSAPEAAGLWLDYMDVGRTPPISRRDLSGILAVITGG